MNPHHDTPRTCARCPQPRTATLGGFCEGHTHEILRALADLPNVYRELRELIGDKPAGGYGDRIRASRVDPPMPLRGDVEAALVDIAETVYAWEHRVRVTLGLPTAPYAPWNAEANRVREACRLLADSHLTLLTLPLAPMMRAAGLDERGGTDAGCELVEVWRRGYHLVRATRPVYVVQVACPSRGCGAPWLSTHGGEGADAWCTACGVSVPWEDYRRLLGEAAEAVSRGERA